MKLYDNNLVISLLIYTLTFTFISELGMMKLLNLTSRFFKKIGFYLVLVTLFIPAGLAQAERARGYILATASTGGTYYPVGVALATLTKIKLAPTQYISVSAINSAGSGENIKLLAENQAQLAILQGLYGAWAWQGTGPFQTLGQQPYLRSITMLWQNVEQFVVKKEYATTGFITDLANLAGEKFSIGKRNSGTEGSGLHILSALSIAPEKLVMANLGYSGSANALQNNMIAGMNIPAGIPTSALTRAFSSQGDNIKLLNFSEADIKQANNGMNLWSRFVIPENTYPGQSKAVTTMAQPNFLAVRADVSEQDVYQITKIIYENLPFLQAIHKATKVMALDKALQGLPVPLHPGAAKFYREMGLLIPEFLKAS